MKTKPQEKKSAKTLKGQLFGALSMMLVAAIALGTSTYAWFINNRTVEVQSMELTVSTSTSLLVAVGKKASIASPSEVGNWTGYKSLVTNQDITGITETGDVAGAALDTADWYIGENNNDRLAQNLLAYHLTPASISDVGLALGATGSTPALKFYSAGNHVVNGKLDEFAEVGIGLTGDDVGMGPVKRIPLKFMSSSDVDVYFGQKDLTTIADMVTAVTKDAKHTLEQGVYDQYAKDIQAALRVAVVPQTDGATLTTVTPVVFQFDSGGKLVATNVNNTDYQHVTDVGDTAATGAADVPNKQDEAKGQYPAIAMVDAGTKYIIGVNMLNAKVPGYTTDAGINADKRLATVTENGGSLDVAAPAADPKPIFQLKAGKERPVDIYIWLEGTDQDCLNALSAHVFNLDLPFAAVETPVTP